MTQSKEQPFEFTISRNKWLRGDVASSCLLDGRGKQCCVGIYLSAVGVESEELLFRRTANEAVCDLPGSADWLIDREDPLVDELYFMNDMPTGKAFTESDRENKIAQLFATRGVHVRFIP